MLYAIDQYYSGLKYCPLPDPKIERTPAPEVRDNEYYARKYADRFSRIWSMIEHGELKFDSKEEEDEAWYATCDAWYRYRHRAERYAFIKENGRDMTDEEYRYKYGYDRDA